MRDYQVRPYPVWHRHLTLAMPAPACLTALRAREPDADKAETDPLPLIHYSLFEIERLISRLTHRQRYLSSTFSTAHTGADGASTKPASATTTTRAQPIEARGVLVLLRQGGLQ